MSSMSDYLRFGGDSHKMWVMCLTGGCSWEGHGVTTSAVQSHHDGHHRCPLHRAQKACGCDGQRKYNIIPYEAEFFPPALLDRIRAQNKVSQWDR